MDDAPRLIEIAFPLKQASITSVHEKNVRHGHISTLHIWPARRPLAASRAALIATLLPDPGDAEQRKILLEKIGGAVTTKLVREIDESGNTTEEEKEIVSGGVLAWGEEDSTEMDHIRLAIRNAYGKAPKVVDPFAGGGAIPLEGMRLGCDVSAADINPVAWFILKCTLEYPQRFAGRTWPLPDFVKQWTDFIEDFRTGKVKKRRANSKPHFTDPKQINFLELPQADLSWHVRAWGRWVLERARQDLSGRYPTIDAEPTLAYLWARTARDKLTAGGIPLLKTFWLCKTAGRRVALLPIPTEDKKGVKFALLDEDQLKRPAEVIQQYPILSDWEVEPGGLIDFLNKGTMNRAGVWSPLSGRPGMISLTMADMRRQGQQGLLGTQMTAAVVERRDGNKTRKAYRLPTPEEIRLAQVDEEDLEEAFSSIPYGIPDEPMPPPGTLGFRIPLYGFTKWRQMFTPRQLLALAVFAKHTREAARQLKEKDADLAEGTTAFLAIFFSRLVDYLNMGCQWELGNAEVKHIMARYALPMLWDFAEANPIAENDRYYAGGVQVASRVLTHLFDVGKVAGAKPTVLKESALSGGRSGFDLVFTDPPYYDAIPYSDLMDFFFIWQKRILSGFNAEFDKAFASECSPKWDEKNQDGELILDESRHEGDKKRAIKAYEDGMARAFQQSLESLVSNGRMVVVFANKQPDAWETLVTGLIRGGGVVTASWPIQTEMPNKVTQKRANLASSVWIVCRKRSQAAQAGWEENVLDAMRNTLFNPRESLGGRNILQYFFDLGIRGPDFLWAALGPALEAYSAHPFVKKTGGGVLAVPEFLSHVRKLVLHFALGELPGFKEISQQTQGRGESLEIDSITQYYLLHRAYFGLEPAPAGACIMYAQACGKSENELRAVWHILEQGGKSKRGRPSSDELEDLQGIESDGKANEFRLVAWQERVASEDLGESKSGQTAPLIDRLHRLMYLFQQNRISEVQQLYETWGLANDRAFVPLLQAVRELALHDNQDTERRLVEALATQLKLNRKQVTVQEMIDNQMTLRVMETDAFEPVVQSKSQAVTYRADGRKRKK